MSAPAANARSLPVRMTQRTVPSRSNASSASPRSFMVAWLRAFKTSGRFRVTRATASSVETRMFAYVIAVSSPNGCQVTKEPRYQAIRKCLSFAWFPGPLVHRSRFEPLCPRRRLLHLRVEQRDQTRGKTLQVFSRGPALWRAQSRAHRLLIVKIHLGNQVVWRLAPARHAGDAPEFHLPQAGPLADEGHVHVPIVTVE